jgi:thiol-disulfide isomerase/thioredoxin
MRFFLVATFNLLLCFTFTFCRTSENDPKTSLIPISLKTLEGDSKDLSDYRGKIVILDFWATWCEPCSKAVPVLNRWQKEVKGEDFTFLGINTDQDEKIETINAHAKTLKMEYPSLLDSDWKLTENYGIDGIPCLLVFGKDGNLLYRQYGVVETDLTGLIMRSRVWVQ